jgi:hypothetical protein
MGHTGRIMHDRHQLRRSDYYGDVNEYYIPVGQNKTMSTTALTEEIIETFEIDSIHRNKIEKIVSKAPVSEIQPIEIQYNEWKKYCEKPSIKYSSLRAPAKNNTEYSKLINLCRSHGKNAMSFLVKKFYEKDPLSTTPICDLLSQYDPDMVIWNSFLTGSMHGTRSLDGKFVRETPRSNWSKYIQKIMDKNDF